MADMLHSLTIRDSMSSLASLGQSTGERMSALTTTPRVDTAHRLAETVRSSSTVSITESIEKQQTDKAITALRAAASSAQEVSGTLSQMWTGTQAAMYTVSQFRAGTITKEEFASKLTDYQASYEQALGSIDESASKSSLTIGGGISAPAMGLDTGVTVYKGADLSATGLKLRERTSIEDTDTEPLYQDVAELAAAVTDASDSKAIDAIETALAVKSSALANAASTASGAQSSFDMYMQDVQSKVHAAAVLDNAKWDERQASSMRAELDSGGAQILALQTRQQIGTQSLSIANQQCQALSALFR